MLKLKIRFFIIFNNFIIFHRNIKFFWRWSTKIIIECLIIKTIRTEKNKKNKYIIRDYTLKNNFLIDLLYDLLIFLSLHPQLLSLVLIIIKI